MRSSSALAFGIRSARELARPILFVGAGLLAGCFSPGGSGGTAASSSSSGGATTDGTGATTADGTASAATTSGTPTTGSVTTETSTTVMTLTGLLTTGSTEATLTTGITDTTITDTTITSLGTTGVSSTGEPGFCGNGEVSLGEECDDGNLSNNDGCDSECVFENRMVFVSSTPFLGADIGGVVGGSKKCNDLADGKDLLEGRKFVAWLSSDASAAADQLDDATVPYVLTDPDETQVASNKGDLLDGILDAAINFNELGNLAMGGQQVWTGTLATGVKASDDCFGWSLAGAGADGMTGLTTETGVLWTENAKASCMQLRPIYCIQTTK